MGEEHSSSKEDVRTLPRQPLKSLEHRRIHSPRTELVYELVVVDRKLFSVVCYSTLYVPGCHDLSMCVFLGRFYRRSMDVPMRCCRYLGL